jgi:hypothetical protein
MRSVTFGFGRGSQPHAVSAGFWLGRARSSCIMPACGVRKGRSSAGSKRSRPYFQRCAVRVTYSKNANSGQWRAHECYLVRESVVFDGGSRGIGFGREGESAELVQRLETWQRAGDERLWKIIISPEFGGRADLKKLTRDLLSGMEPRLNGLRLHTTTRNTRTFTWRSEASALRASQFASAGTTLGRAFAKSLKIPVHASSDIVRNGTQPQWSVGRYMNIATLRLTGLSSATERRHRITLQNLSRLRLTPLRAKAIRSY